MKHLIMKHPFYTVRRTRYALLAATMGLLACGSDDAVFPTSLTDGDRTYDIQIVNLTHNQPFSPAAIIAHTSGYTPFTESEAASNALEQLAEGGDNAAFILEAQTATQYVDHATTALIAAKSASDSVTIEVPSSQTDDIKLSVVTMLVNTNDAFTGVNAADLSDLAVSDTLIIQGPTWDAGTELNTESVGTIPGPADNGTGYVTTRDDLYDRVHIHPGVITADDGLSTSVLNDDHRFLNPSSRIVITRTQ
ncbi:MAG: spondin domain-containing protein [Gammaproteobacteria bacterium]